MSGCQERTAAGWAKQGDIYREMLAQNELLTEDERDQTAHLGLAAFAKALQHYKHEVPQNPHFVAWVEAHKGALLTQRKRFTEAMAAFDKSVKLSPKYAWGWAHRGDCLRLLGVQKMAAGLLPDAQLTFEDAIGSFKNAIDNESGYAWAYAHMGAVYRFKGVTPDERFKNNGEAVRCFEKAQLLSDDYTWAKVYATVSMKVLAKREPHWWRPAYLELAHAAKTYPDIFKGALHDQCIDVLSDRVSDMEESDNPVEAFFRAGLRMIKKKLDPDDKDLKLAEEALLF